MASLLHIVDTDGLEKNPNLKFDPQNAASFLDPEHPKFKEMAMGLTPEQLEVLQSTTQVDGYDDPYEGEEVLHGGEKFIDPDTGEEIKLNDSDISLDDIGFTNPERMEAIILEAFHNPRFYGIAKSIDSKRKELELLQVHLESRGLISNLDAQNVNNALGGLLFGNVIMESFTKQPTKCNYSLVMEEIDHAKTALAAGGAIVGATILYKLVKWFLNSWNRNGGAGSSIAANIQAIRDRKPMLQAQDNVIKTANIELSKASKEFKAQLGNMNEVTDIQAALKVIEGVEKEALKGTYSNLWVSIANGSSVNVAGGSFQANNNFFKQVIPNVIDVCLTLQNVINNQVDIIRSSSADKTIQPKDDDYNKALEGFKIFGKACGYNVEETAIEVYASGLMNHISSNIVKPFGDVTKIQKVPSSDAVQVIDPDTFGKVDDDYLKLVENFDKEIKGLQNVGATEVKGVALPNGMDKTKEGNRIQRSSKVGEYEKLTKAFRAEMCILRGVLNLRNNVGKGLNALNGSQAKMFNTK